MLYLLSAFSDVIGPLNVLRCITFRTAGAIITALILFFFAPRIIRCLRIAEGKRQQPMPADGGTPTTGGLMILCGIVGSTLLWANPANRYVWIVLGTTFTFGALGFCDDYLKVAKPGRSNITGRFDGLAIVLVIVMALSVGFISYLSGNSFLAKYVNIQYMPGTGELAVLCGSVIGATLGFIWSNTPRAPIFLGSAGSLALGALIGTIAVTTLPPLMNG